MSDRSGQRPYTTTEAAAFLAAEYGLKFSPRTIARYIDSGAIGGTRTKGGDRRVPVAALRAFARRFTGAS